MSILLRVQAIPARKVRVRDAEELLAGAPSLVCEWLEWRGCPARPFNWSCAHWPGGIPPPWPARRINAPPTLMGDWYARTGGLLWASWAFWRLVGGAMEANRRAKSRVALAAAEARALDWAPLDGLTDVSWARLLRCLRWPRG